MPALYFVILECNCLVGDLILMGTVEAGFHMTIFSVNVRCLSCPGFSPIWCTLVGFIWSSFPSYFAINRFLRRSGNGKDDLKSNVAYYPTTMVREHGYPFLLRKNQAPTTFCSIFQHGHGFGKRFTICRLTFFKFCHPLQSSVIASDEFKLLCKCVWLYHR